MEGIDERKMLYIPGYAIGVSNGIRLILA